jgi:mono/diheme cytochrome c family protein
MLYRSAAIAPVLALLAASFFDGLFGGPGLLSTTVQAADTSTSDLEYQFNDKIHPILAANCFACHGGEKKEGDLDLSSFATMADVIKQYGRFETVRERLEAKEMPPAKAKHQPTSEERLAIVEWIATLKKQVAKESAGDPGPVLARRLSNAEYNYTIRDLIGFDIQPTKEFPVDPANEAGFDNSGESLAMSPALLKKYLDAARDVAQHLVLKPEGFVFAPYPIVNDTDRDKFAITQIIDFYKRQPTDFADYFLAAWRYKNRTALGKPDATLADIAADSKVSSKYLAIVWTALTETPVEVGPMAKVQAMWRDLPAPTKDQPDVARAGCEKLRDYVVPLRAKLAMHYNNLELKNIAPGSQPFILWKDRQLATHRTTLNGSVLQVEGQFRPDPGGPRPEETADAAADDAAAPAAKATPDAAANKTVAANNAAAAANDNEPGNDPFVQKTPEQIAAQERRAKARRAAMRQPILADPELAVPADETERARFIASFEAFCKVFPDAFIVSERGRMHVDRMREVEKGRLLTAGFHNSMGYFRDDLPLYEMILGEPQQRELDRLWQELDFITGAPERQLKDFIFYERAEPPRTIKGPEFDFIRSEDKDVASEAKLMRMRDVYLTNARQVAKPDGGSDVALQAIEDHFTKLNNDIRWVEQAQMAAEPSHLKSVLDFGQRAYRRPLTDAERDSILKFYHSLRDEDGLNHEEAIRDSIVSVLMSPHFCYRFDLVDAGNGARPLSDYALASRLSYFLWSSMPDDELLAHAAAGDLHQPEMLVAQARRMMQDKRIRGLAVEFSGNWLDYRRFEEHNAVDRDRFPTFDNALRQSMFEEPVRFFLDVVKNSRSVLDFLYASDTFVNPALAKHYGIPDLKAESDQWVHVENADKYQRGGLLPMSVFLTKNAPGLRTSPVKRGYWVVRRVLGERIPPPPAQVPELPHDEAQLGDLTLREVLAKHRENASCAACHERFDSMGLVFEGYGPVGEARAKDLGGRPVDTRATFPGGSEGAGLEGLRKYIREHRQEDFVDNLCRKMLSYALGRTLILSDDPAIQEMREKLAANDYRFGVLIESIVTSPQFLTKRARDEVAQQGE